MAIRRMRINGNDETAFATNIESNPVYPMSNSACAGGLKGFVSLENSGIRKFVLPLLNQFPFPSLTGQCH